MSHSQQLDFFHSVAQYWPEFFNGRKVAEIGSLDINGSIRQCFNTHDYTGFDVLPGPGVDLAIEGQLISSPTEFYDVCASAECFEHNPFWVESFSNMLRMTKAGGLIIFSCATTGRQEHGTTRTSPFDSPLTTNLGWDYYRNLDANDFLTTFNMGGWFAAFDFLFCPETFDLYFYGFRQSEEITFNQEQFLANQHLLTQKIYALNKTVSVGTYTLSRGWIPR